jgi:hypothetical protein
MFGIKKTTKKVCGGFATRHNSRKPLGLCTVVMGVVLLFNLFSIPLQAKTNPEYNNNAVVIASKLKHVIPVASGVNDVVVDGKTTGWTAMLDYAGNYEKSAMSYATGQTEEAVAVVKIKLPGGTSGKSLYVSLWSPEIKADSRLNAYRYSDGEWKKISASVRAEHIDLDMTGNAEAIVMLTKYPAFRYVHNPAENYKVLKDAIVNPDAVYGFSPNPESARLKEYVNYLDWTDPAAVAQARKEREEYHKNNEQLYRLIEQLLGEGKDIETIARTVSRRRNEIRLESYNNDPEKLASVKKSNLEAYGNEEGPTADSLYAKYGSWQTVLEKALSTNAGMDACLGLYDEYYDILMMNQ